MGVEIGAGLRWVVGVCQNVAGDGYRSQVDVVVGVIKTDTRRPTGSPDGQVPRPARMPLLLSYSKLIVRADNRRV